MLLSTLAKPMNGVRATMNGFSVIMDPMLLIMDLYLPTIRDDFVGEASQKRDSEIIIYNCFIVLLYLMEMDPSNEDYYAIFIDVLFSIISSLAVSLPSDSSCRNEHSITVCCHLFENHFVSDYHLT